MEAEQHARQLWWHHQFQQWLFGDIRGNLLRHGHTVVDDLRVFLLAQRFQAHPQLQRVKATGGLQRFGYQVRYASLFVKLRVQVSRLIAHQLIVTRFFQQECAAADGLEELLVEVQGNGIHQLDTVEVIAILFRHQQCAAPGRIHVNPDILLRRQFRNRPQRINSARVGGSCGGNDRQNLFTVGIALRDFRSQIGQIHARTFVSFHLDNGLIAEAHQRHILLHGEVRAVGAQHPDLTQIAHQTILLDGVALTRKESIARQHQTHHVALGAAAGEDTGVAWLVPQTGTQPLDQFYLDNGRRRALIPGVHALVSGVDHHFRRLAYHQAWAVEVRHTLRMVHRQAVLQEIFNGTLDGGLVTQPFRAEIQVDTFAQFGDRFTLVHFRLFQPLHNRLGALLDGLLIGFDALRRRRQNRV